MIETPKNSFGVKMDKVGYRIKNLERWIRLLYYLGLEVDKIMIEYDINNEST